MIYAHCPQAQTQTCTHIHVHIRTHIHMYAYLHMPTHTYTQSRAHTCLHADVSSVSGAMLRRAGSSLFLFNHRCT